MQERLDLCSQGKQLLVYFFTILTRCMFQGKGAQKWLTYFKLPLTARKGLEMLFQTKSRKHLKNEKIVGPKKTNHEKEETDKIRADKTWSDSKVNCLLKFPKAFRQKHFKLVLQSRFYYVKKKKKKLLWRPLFQVFVYIRIHDLGDLSSANSIKSWVLNSYLKKQYLLWRKGSWQFMVKVLGAIIYTKSITIRNPIEK